MNIDEMRLMLQLYNIYYQHKEYKFQIDAKKMFHFVKFVVYFLIRV